MPALPKKWWIGLGLLGAGAVLCAGSLPSSFSESLPASPGFDLPPETSVRHELQEGESHDYRLPLASGEVVDVQVEQRGIDVSLILSSPEEETLLSMDTPKGTQGSERLFAIAETGGVYRLRVQAEAAARRGPGRSYVLRIAKPEAAAPMDRLRARAWREYARGESLRRVSGRRALAHYSKAVRLWRTSGDRDQEATALYRRAGILRSLNDLPGAVETYESALPLVRDPGLRLSVLNLLTNLHVDLGNKPRAFQTGQIALKLAPRVGEPVSHAAALNNLGKIYRSWGETDKALKYFDESLKKWQEVGPNTQMARTLSNRAEVLFAAGNPGAALRPLLEALQMQEELGDLDGQALTSRTLGVAFDRLGKTFTARRFLDLAHQKARSTGNRWVEGLVLNDEGSALLLAGRYDEAWGKFQEAERIAREGGNKDNEAYASAGLGNVLAKRGDGAGAVAYFARSEKLYSELGEPHGLSTVLYQQALAQRALGSAEDALTTIERALKLVEELRKDVEQQDLRLHVIGRRADLYDLKVDLLLRLDEEKPGHGFDTKAFAASEWRRARSLLEMVKTMGAGLPRDLSTEGLRRQEVLRLHLQRLAEEKLKIVPAARAAVGRRSLPEVEQEIRETLEKWESLSEEMRRQSPAYAVVAAPKLIGVREVQELLDGDTAVVAYTVSEERSILWWIERDALEVHPTLPSRAKLEPLAGEAYSLLSKRSQTKNRGRSQRTLEDLGKALLKPIVDRLPRVRRVVVVTDEALQALPFATLPVPGSGAPLIESHAVVQLPSASLAVALCARQRGRVAPSGVMAVFGDPVFGRSDPRFWQQSGISRDAGDLAIDELPRLPESAREVETIFALVPAARSRRFTGFAAHRHAAMDPGIARFRYLHFATHSLVDLKNPNLSGIQLSRIDPQGRSVPGKGILPFYEVYNLRFSADLVTLSACRTAVGPRVLGEGLLGVSRSFLYAGASRVLGTLWDVDDKDAADLMTLFYQALLRDGKSPAMALQDAQNAMRAREKTRAPYHWAGFVLQGDWR